jgi:hypothetical protein
MHAVPPDHVLRPTGSPTFVALFDTNRATGVTKMIGCCSYSSGNITYYELVSMRGNTKMRKKILLETPKILPHCEAQVFKIWNKVMVIITIYKSQDGN